MKSKILWGVFTASVAVVVIALFASWRARVHEVKNYPHVFGDDPDLPLDGEYDGMLNRIDSGSFDFEGMQKILTVYVRDAEKREVDLIVKDAYNNLAFTCTGTVADSGNFHCDVEERYSFAALSGKLNGRTVWFYETVRFCEPECKGLPTDAVKDTDTYTFRGEKTDNSALWWLGIGYCGLYAAALVAFPLRRALRTRRRVLEQHALTHQQRLEAERTALLSERAVIDAKVGGIERALMAQTQPYRGAPPSGSTTAS